MGGGVHWDGVKVGGGGGGTLGWCEGGGVGVH